MLKITRVCSSSLAMLPSGVPLTMDSDSDEDMELKTFLGYYEKWAVNCARRDVVGRATKMQREMRRSNQLAPMANIQSARDRFVAIPSPGVPEDLPVDKNSIGKHVFESAAKGRGAGRDINGYVGSTD